MVAGTIQTSDARTSGREPVPPRRDSGVTFVEIVVTIVLMGVIVVPILAAVRTSIRASSVSEIAAEVETVLVNAVDRVSRAPRPAFSCDPDLTRPARAAAETHGWDASTVSVRHRHWAGTDWSDWGEPCPASGFSTNLVQLIEITVTDPDGRVSRTLEVVKGAQL